MLLWKCTANELEMWLRLGVRAWLGLDCGLRVGLWLSVRLKVKLHTLITVSASTLNVITMHKHVLT